MDNIDLVWIEYEEHIKRKVMGQTYNKRWHMPTQKLYGRRKNLK